MAFNGGIGGSLQRSSFRETVLTSLARWVCDRIVRANRRSRGEMWLNRQTHTHTQTTAVTLLRMRGGLIATQGLVSAEPQNMYKFVHSVDVYKFVHHQTGQNVQIYSINYIQVDTFVISQWRSSDLGVGQANFKLCACAIMARENAQRCWLYTLLSC